MMQSALAVFNIVPNALQLYLVADFKNENFKYKQNYVRKQKLE